MSNRTRVLDYELNPPDFDFVRSLAEAMGMPLPDCMALLTRPLESLPGDHTPTQIKDGSIVTLNLRRKLGRLPRIPELENLGSLRALNCSLHWLNELDLRGNPQLQSLDCSGHFTRDFTIDISRCHGICDIRYAAYITFDRKYYTKLRCTELQKQYLFPRARKGFELLPSDTAELHEFAKHYNWDAGVRIPRWIIRQESCDRGTALMIFWMGGPTWYTQYAKKSDVPSHELEGYNLIKEIERRYKRGFYQNSDFFFDPRDDNGYDWTKQHLNIKPVKPIPELMCKPSKVRSRREQTMKERVPNQDELQELAQTACALGIECLGFIVDLPANLDDSAAVIRAIRQCVDKVRQGAKLPRDYEGPEQAAGALGTLWGDQLCRAFKWEWVYLQAEGGFEGWAVVSPDRSYACFPHHFISGKLVDPESDNTIALLFNMIEAGNLPQSSPGAYMLLR